MTTLALGAENLEDFRATWWAPFRRFAPVEERASTADPDPDVGLGKPDTEAEKALSAAARISSVPTPMVLRRGVRAVPQAGALLATGLGEQVTAARALDVNAARATDDAAQERSA